MLQGEALASVKPPPLLCPLTPDLPGDHLCNCGAKRASGDPSVCAQGDHGGGGADRETQPGARSVPLPGSRPQIQMPVPAGPGRAPELPPGQDCCLLPPRGAGEEAKISISPRCFSVWRTPWGGWLRGPLRGAGAWDRRKEAAEGVAVRGRGCEGGGPWADCPPRHPHLSGRLGAGPANCAASPPRLPLPSTPGPGRCPPQAGPEAALPAQPLAPCLGLPLLRSC